MLEILHAWKAGAAYFLRSGSTCSSYAVNAVSITWCMS